MTNKQAQAAPDSIAPSIAMVAGEASGDLLASLLLDGLRQRWPDASSMGIGGDRMQERGFDAWWQSERLAVHGYSWEVLARVAELLGIRKKLRQRLIAHPPSVFVGVDAPDFNLGLETGLREAGIKTVHFVCPSIWAWRADRVEKIRRAADHVLCIFPFEPELLAQHGIEATYVGHPLAQVIPLHPDRAAARARLGLAEEGLVLALLPGSRRSEVRYIASGFFKAAALVQKALPQTRIVVPAVPSLYEEVQRIAAEAGMQGKCLIVKGQSHDVLAACDCTLIASGTATLEAALYKRPMVISYSMHPWSWRLMKRKQLQPWVGLPNILCGDFVVPELLQDAATPEALAQAALGWLRASQDSPATIEALVERFTALHHELRRDTAELAAHAIQKIIATPAA
ncbi:MULTISPECIES: lipid-A-disaccharide synthase [Comamonas]|uniref:Lipid-A-disaccharide synthase n=1 Tax=Comamonas thiooxydans TaxID=363952 RepID=A0A0E3BGC4_9BURK|nr:MULTISPECIES: lipid-A-disaccharide synthase [Comamonas]ACY33965.1 lipid-A-disaccharide synthase [Comamonas thiooxydans]KGG86758.1 lipid-A-disaccharide synthase [Comamonas thiooxydans]KGG92529.1 lipid-A-disaccharide synthase [Comamonas thiooxydans]KKI12026.1 lipid-A-disaccharide synthase [Comamonas thiooxydans]MCO8251373.1 lipid-A-disaccharide synthase [Comamonas thiooxydans]